MTDPRHTLHLRAFQPMLGSRIKEKRILIHVLNNLHNLEELRRWIDESVYTRCAFVRGESIADIEVHFTFGPYRLRPSAPTKEPES